MPGAVDYLELHAEAADRPVIKGIGDLTRGFVAWARYCDERAEDGRVAGCRGCGDCCHGSE